MREVLMALCYPLIVITLPIWVIIFLMEWHFLPGEWLLWRRMKRASRTLRPNDLSQFNHGTVIVDRPTFSWGQSRIWFTPDLVSELAPVPPPEEKDSRDDDFTWHPYFRWLHKHYSHPSTGSAKLIHTWHGAKRLPTITAINPNLRVIVGFSGGEDMEAAFGNLEKTSPVVDPRR